MKSINLAFKLAEVIRSGKAFSANVEFYSNSNSPLVVRVYSSSSNADEQGYVLADLWDQEKESWDLIVRFTYMLLGKY